MNFQYFNSSKYLINLFFEDYVYEDPRKKSTVCLIYVYTVFVKDIRKIYCSTKSNRYKCNKI